MSSAWFGQSRPVRKKRKRKDHRKVILSFLFDSKAQKNKGVCRFLSHYNAENHQKKGRMKNKTGVQIITA